MSNEELVQRLRGGNCPLCGGGGEVAFCGEMIACECLGQYEQPISMETRLKAAAALTAKDAEIAALRERVAELEAGLRPFVDALEEMRFDRDHRGNPFPDSDPCGWIYVTLGDFRRARALLEPEASHDR